uniref:Serpentine receptor class gamma n=1 Tax=Strongyloides stercoralis TaxID=6248 RepID=A0AAF5I101_STRER
MRQKLKRLPNLKFVNDQYVKVKTLNGIFFGLSTILPASIGFGQFALVMNRYVAVKYPILYKRIFCFKALFLIYFFQILIMSPGIIMCVPYHANIIYQSQKNVIIINFPHNKPIKILSILNVILGTTLALSSSILGIFSWRILKKRKYSRNENNLEYKKQMRFLIFVIIQTLTDTFLHVTNLIYLILILFRLKSIVLMTSFIYYFAEDFCFLTTPIVLCITQKRIRNLFIEFYFGFLLKRKSTKKKRMDKKIFAIKRPNYSKDKFNRIQF